MAADEQDTPGWRERRKAAKREKAERTGDAPEKRAEREADPDSKDAASGAAIRGTVSTPPAVGGLGGGGGF
jgi:hypothetical protein